jgi:toxin HigB-1
MQRSSIFFMIIGFRDADTKRFWETGCSRRIPANLRMRALKRLFLLHAAVSLDNLSVPPGNRLEALHGERKGQHSIRINDRYRLCFVWLDGNAHDVEIVDYH